MKIYQVDINYIKYLHQYDSRVQYNPDYSDLKNQNRPYIGVLLNVNGNNYFAPLEHPRASHQTLKSNLHIYKIKGGKYGVIGLNNMIPVPQTALLNFDINTNSNRNILIAQFIACKNDWTNIQNRANQIYNKRVTAPNKFEKKMFCDFKFLEQKCSEYIQTKTQEQTQINNQTQPQSLADKIKSAQQKADKINQNRDNREQPKKDKEQEH